jgi:hypothetical protein
MSRVFDRLVILLSSSSLMACTFLGRGGDDDDDLEVETEGESESEPDPWPTEGFRVFPWHRLHAVAAVVTIEIGDAPQGCPPDPIDGGYVCDAEGLVDGPVTIVVKHDGFDPAVRHPSVMRGQLVPVDVHLAPAGGPTGTWSDCVEAIDVHSCSDLCESEGRQCAPASCPSEDPESPLATHETFAEPDCTGTALASLPSTCAESLEDDVVAVRCCCEP